MKLGLLRIFVVDRKRKAEDEPDGVPKKIKLENEDALKKQNKIMFRHREALSNLKKKELAYILECNEQYIPSGDSKVTW